MESQENNLNSREAGNKTLKILNPRDTVFDCNLVFVMLQLDEFVSLLGEVACTYPYKTDNISIKIYHILFQLMMCTHGKRNNKVC